MEIFEKSYMQLGRFSNLRIQYSSVVQTLCLALWESPWLIPGFGGVSGATPRSHHQIRGPTTANSREPCVLLTGIAG
jgi:hypothetical protein